MARMKSLSFQATVPSAHRGGACDLLRGLCRGKGRQARDSCRGSGVLPFRTDAEKQGAEASVTMFPCVPVCACPLARRRPRHVRFSSAAPISRRACEALSDGAMRYAGRLVVLRHSKPEPLPSWNAQAYPGCCGFTGPVPHRSQRATTSRRARNPWLPHPTPRMPPATPRYPHSRLPASNGLHVSREVSEARLLRE